MAVIDTKYLDPSGLLYVWNKIKELLSQKVDKIPGKTLSTNDYTTLEKIKLSNIESGAQVNVNADWNAVSGDAVILHRPSIPDKVSDLENDLNFTTAEECASSSIPRMNGAAAVGSELAFSRGDHVHPSDSTKVDKVLGKGLSTEDFTNAFKTKLEGIAENADVSVQSDWTATTGKAAILNKPIIPTRVSELINDNNYITDSSMTTAINEAIGSITEISYSIVNELPAAGETGVIYLIYHPHGNQDSYDEYIYYNDSFEKIGNTDIDLSDYIQLDDLIAISNQEIDDMIDGN